MTNRYRAGQPADLTFSRCPAASSGCNGPREGECMGYCDYPFYGYDSMPVKFAGTEPSETPLRARIMDACADALDYVLDRLWVGAAVIVSVVAALVWSLR